MGLFKDRYNYCKDKIIKLVKLRKKVKIIDATDKIILPGVIDTHSF